ncbi:CheR family methyltransferase [Spirochaeta cellobiosiphila]|uniref:CheR family methyltransferase n=1 Tax=Spirochaeta cellobiosiphila TaxID=504483 RepID=UPI00042342B3|nr:CheR family methyltransferase [Spirochaeta cellobiosiphila]
MSNNQTKQKDAVNESVEKEQINVIDTKMVTFTLAGKDYGIDIMKVKEIRKAGNFTFVPNTPPFVRGVDNLRGEIISIIDLRIMFNLPAPQNDPTELENILILRLENNVIGVVVDSIDKVVGIASTQIQPPHPLFGDINIKYISGVVENEERLYIILDAEAVFDEKEEEAEVIVQRPTLDQNDEELTPTKSLSEAIVPEKEDIGLKFIKETLSTFKKYYVTSLNNNWVENRYAEWKEHRETNGKDVQLSDAMDAEEFLTPFYSPYTNKLWDASYGEQIASLVQDHSGKMIRVWNIGCGKGAESYSLAVSLKKRFTDKQVKIWANDSDLLSISSAPTMLIPQEQLSDEYLPYVIDVKGGKQFSKNLKDSITFEYHDVTNVNPFEDLDMIIARDVLSFLKKGDQHRVLESFMDKLKPGGLLILGQNESPLEYGGWISIEKGTVVGFTKKSD